MQNKLTPNKTQVILAFTAVYLIWGSTYLAIRFTIETLPLFLTAGLRFFLAGFMLYIFMRIKGQPKPQPQHWKSAFIVGGFLLLGGNGSVVWAERFIPSGITALFIAITPVWMVILQWLWLGGKRPSLKVITGIVLGFIGVFILIGPGLFAADPDSFHLGAVLVLLAASISWAVGSVYSRKAPLPESPFLSIGMEMMAGGFLLLLLGFAHGEIALCNPENFSPKSLGAFLYLIFFGSLIGFTAYIWLLKNVGVAKASTYAFVNPVVAVVLGWILAGETFSGVTVIAVTFVVAAVIVITLSQGKDEKIDAVGNKKILI